MVEPTEAAHIHMDLLFVQGCEAMALLTQLQDTKILQRNKRT